MKRYVFSEDKFQFFFFNFQDRLLHFPTQPSLTSRIFVISLIGTVTNTLKALGCIHFLIIK